MMKFRVWCKNKNEWEKDFAVMDQDGRFYFMYNSILQPVNTENHIVERFIGMDDKNGVDIYEGDIVSICNLSTRYTICFYNCRFVGVNIDDPRMPVDMPFDNQGIEVVGNIHL